MRLTILVEATIVSHRGKGFPFGQSGTNSLLLGAQDKEIPMKIKPYSALAIFVFLITCMLVQTHAACADNSHIPDEYESAYHHLLERKQHLMEDRAESIKNIEQCESWLTQVDKAISAPGSAIARQKLQASRTYIMSLEDKFHRDLNYEEQSLLTVEKDLAWIESEMKHFAVLGWR